MNQSDTIEKLAEALAKAQGQIEGAKKDSQAVITGNLKRKYADLASVWDACRAPLSENGLSVVQFAEGGPQMATITTRLLHASGQWLESTLTVGATKPDAQGLGSALTYGRRYSLMAMVGIAPEDDDGQAACQQPEMPRQAPRPQPVQAIPQAGPGGRPDSPMGKMIMPNGNGNGPGESATPKNMVTDESTDETCKRLALDITRMINAGLISPDDVRIYGKLDSIKAAQEAGDIKILNSALILLQEYVHLKSKEMAEAS